METLKVCACGREFTEEQSSGDVCFRCKVDTIGFTWRGPTRASKQNFHDYTIREAIAEGDANIRANGGDPKEFESATRWV